MLVQGSQDVSVPGLGDALDAGADVVGAINTNVVNPLANIAVEISAAAPADVGALESFIEGKILSLGVIVVDRAGDPNVVDGDDVDVEATCGNSLCANSETDFTLISDLQVVFRIGQEISETPAFDIGIDGLPIEVSGATEASGNWSLDLGVGLSKAEGPYILANLPDPELNLGASVALADNPNGCDANPGLGTSFPQPAEYPGSPFPGFSDTRCLEGQLAFLAVGLHDGNSPGGADNDDPTTVSLTTTLDLTSTAANGRLTAGNIINNVGLEPRFEATANIDLALRTSIALEGVLPDGLPGVVGAFHLYWSFDTNNPDLGAPAVVFDSLYIDAGTFVSDLLGPIVT
jgi:hypothetical protein